MDLYGTHVSLCTDFLFENNKTILSINVIA